MSGKWFAERRRILWVWCAGHQEYEIAAVERMIGSQEFERRLLEKWNSTVPYRITLERASFTANEHPWHHAP